MKVIKVLSRIRKIPCPDCGHEMTVIVVEDKNSGEERCPKCGTVFVWDRADEIAKMMKDR